MLIEMPRSSNSAEEEVAVLSPLFPCEPVFSPPSPASHSTEPATHKVNHSNGCPPTLLDPSRLETIVTPHNHLPLPSPLPPIGNNNSNNNNKDPSSPHLRSNMTHSSSRSNIKNMASAIESVRMYLESIPPDIPCHQEVRDFQFWKSVRTEFLATFLFVIISCGLSAKSTPEEEIDPIIPAVGVGLVTVILMHITSRHVKHYSSCHLNPCLTFAVYVTKHRPVSCLKLILFIVAQLLASILGSLIVFSLTLYGPIPHVSTQSDARFSSTTPPPHPFVMSLPSITPPVTHSSSLDLPAVGVGASDSHSSLMWASQSLMSIPTSLAGLPPSNIFGFEFLASFLVILTYLSVTDFRRHRSNHRNLNQSKGGYTATPSNHHPIIGSPSNRTTNPNERHRRGRSSHAGDGRHLLHPALDVERLNLIRQEPNYCYVGFALTVATLFSGKFSGGSLNPVRMLGPALFTNNWHHHWVYWVGPLLGSLFAAFTYEYIRSSKTQTSPSEREDGQDCLMRSPSSPVRETRVPIDVHFSSDSDSDSSTNSHHMRAGSSSICPQPPGRGGGGTKGGDMTQSNTRNSLSSLLRSRPEPMTEMTCISPAT